MYADPSYFVGAVRAWLQERSRVLREESVNEPRRLFSKQEYRAALILAFAGIETEFRQRFQSLERAKFSAMRISPMSYLIEQARDQRLISDDDATGILNIMSWRNEAVHTNSEISRRQADLAVKLYEQVRAMNQDPA